MARKPLIGTVAENVIQFGTGALNIDACRVAAADAEEGRTRHGGGIVGNGTSYELPDSNGATPAGRWPANVIHDGSDEAVGAFPETAPSPTGLITQGGDHFSIGSNERTRGTKFQGHGDSGSAARFFYSAKADADDRLGSKHPTVKPLDLMQYLVRLVTPPGGTVLDLFAGTGTTGEAAWREGFRAVLIEREAEYQADIRRRMAHALAGPDERKRAIAKAKHGDEPFSEGLFA
jgi:hypothetical protein